MCYEEFAMVEEFVGLRVRGTGQYRERFRGLVRRVAATMSYQELSAAIAVWAAYRGQ